MRSRNDFEEFVYYACGPSVHVTPLKGHIFLMWESADETRCASSCGFPENAAANRLVEQVLSLTLNGNKYNNSNNKKKAICDLLRQDGTGLEKKRCVVGGGTCACRRDRTTT